MLVTSLFISPTKTFFNTIIFSNIYQNNDRIESGLLPISIIIRVHELILCHSAQFLSIYHNPPTLKKKSILIISLAQIMHIGAIQWTMTTAHH